MEEIDKMYLWEDMQNISIGGMSSRKRRQEISVLVVEKVLELDLKAINVLVAQLRKGLKVFLHQIGLVSRIIYTEINLEKGKVQCLKEKDCHKIEGKIILIINMVNGLSREGFIKGYGLLVNIGTGSRLYIKEMITLVKIVVKGEESLMHIILSRFLSIPNCVINYLTARHCVYLAMAFTTKRNGGDVYEG